MIISQKQQSLKPTDVFIGFTDETVASLVYRICKERYEHEMVSESYDASWVPCIEHVKLLVKQLLIQSSTSDGIIRLSMLANEPTGLSRSATAYLRSSDDSQDTIDTNFVIDTYYNKQNHDHFAAFFRQNCLRSEVNNHPFVQITTHSKLVCKRDIQPLRAESSALGKDLRVRIESLLSFDTQQQFVQVLHEFFNLVRIKIVENENNGNNKININDDIRHLMIIQCEYGHFNQELIACARFTIIDEYDKFMGEFKDDDTVVCRMRPFHIVLIIQIPKISGGCLSGFQTSKW